MKTKNTCCLIFVFLGNSFSIQAADTFPSGYGIKNTTMGGASIALPYDSLAPANNPAGLSKVGDRADLSVKIVRAIGHNSYGDENNRNSLNMTSAFPEFGVSYGVDDKLSIGLAVYGSGLQAAYEKPIAPNQGLNNLAVHMTSLSISPTVAYKVSSNVTVGLSPIIQYSTFNAQGFPGVQKKDETAYGVGYKAGLLWDVNDKFSLGAAYSPRIKMSGFDYYKDNILSSSDGRYDIAEQVALGASFRPVQRVTIALDYLRYFWKDVDFFKTSGFPNQNVWRLGVAVDVTDKLSLRTGYYYASDIFNSESNNQNFIGPAISTRNYSAGFSYDLPAGYELSAGVERAVPRNLKGRGESQGTNIDINYGFFLLGVSKKF